MPTADRYEARRSEGVCVGCGRKQPAPERVRCKACLKAVREASAERARLLTQAGTCRTCGAASAKRGHRDCAGCLERYAQYTAQKKSGKRRALDHHI